MYTFCIHKMNNQRNVWTYFKDLMHQTWIILLNPVKIFFPLYQLFVLIWYCVNLCKNLCALIPKSCLVLCVSIWSVAWVHAFLRVRLVLWVRLHVIYYMLTMRLVMACYLFENDVDVTSDELRNLLSFSGLNRVVTILIVSKVLKKKD